MNGLDILLILPLAWGAYKGYRNGLILELGTFAGLLAGTYAAIHFSGIAEPYLDALIGEDPERTPLIAFVLTFLLVLFLVYLIARLLRGMVRFVALGILDRLLGGLFGLLRMALFMLVLLILVRTLSSGTDGAIPGNMQEGSLILREMDRLTEEVMQWDLGKDWPFQKDQEAETR